VNENKEGGNKGKRWRKGKERRMKRKKIPHAA
jgi:hypothetical protein